jgi:hypothetical protein
MNISKFKLISGGYVGIYVEAIESIVQDDKTILDKVQRTRPYPIPDFLRNKIQKLKYFYLNLTGHWVEPFNKYFNNDTYEMQIPEGGSDTSRSYVILQSLLNHTEITGVSTRDAGFCITGTIETVEGKKMGYPTPFVTEEDDVSFYIEATDKINVIIDDITKLLRSTKAIEFNVSAVAKAIGMHSEVTEGLSKQEMIDLVIEGLHQRGAIVLEPGDFTDNIEGGKIEGKVTLHTGTGSIDSHNMPEAKIEKDDKKKKKEEKLSSPVNTIPDKKPVGKGTLASDKDFPILDDRPAYVRKRDGDIPEGGSVEDLEYSENMGLERDRSLIEDMSSQEQAEDNELG